MNDDSTTQRAYIGAPTLPEKPAMPAPATKPALYWVLEFTTCTDNAECFTHETHLVAAMSQDDAIAVMRAHGFAFHNHCYITTDKTAHRGGAQVLNIQAFKNFTLTQEQYRHWLKINSTPHWSTGEAFEATYTRMKA